MYKQLSSVILATSIIATGTLNVSAHVMNGDNMYTDIAHSESKSAILFTHSLQLITTDSSLYKPEDILTKKDFALWYAHFKGWDGEENALIQKAVEADIIVSTDGNLTYQELNKAIFDGKVSVENDAAEMTRGEYATFIMKHVGETLKDGHTLTEQLGYKEGPTGTIETVEQVKDEHYVLTIDGKEYMLAEHPSVDSDSNDPLVWEGQDVKESLVTKNTASDRDGKGSQSDEAKLQYLVVGQDETETADDEDQTSSKTTAEKNKTDTEKNAENSSITWIIGIAIVLVLVITSVSVIIKVKKK